MLQEVLLLLTSRVSVLEVWVETFVHELDHLVHSTGLDVVHELLKTGLQVGEEEGDMRFPPRKEKMNRKRTTR